jgi:SAM-dependent methyltransferase
MDSRQTASARGAAGATDAVKARQRAIWALGDFHRVARDVVWDLGPVLVDACRVQPGHRVLDVGAGTGNAAIRAAEQGADVVASDLTPELFDAGRREASSRGVELEWIEADAEGLPFEDGAFDVVMSSIGVMFAPDHRAAAGELVRVCRPGGTVGMINWTPEGYIGQMFALFARYTPPPPPGVSPPVLWGDEEHVRGLIGDRTEALEMSRGHLVVDHFATPVDACRHAKQHFGPTIAAYAGLEDDPERAAALDRDFIEFATRWSRGAPGGPAVYGYEYLLVVARRPTA